MHKTMYDWDRLATGTSGNKFDFGRFYISSNKHIWIARRVVPE
jgi:hypothetical protein